MPAPNDPPTESRLRLLADAIAYFAGHGVGDTSLRGLAAEIGTSHRMLIYHFGSRDGLLSAVVEVVEAEQLALLEDVLGQTGTPTRARLYRFWRQVGDAAQTYGPLMFELSADAMQHRPHARTLRESLITPWLDTIAAMYVRAGYERRPARTQARISLAVARGLLFDLLVTDDRAGVDAAMHAHIRATVPRPS